MRLVFLDENKTHFTTKITKGKTKTRNNHKGLFCKYFFVLFVSFVVQAFRFCVFLRSTQRALTMDFDTLSRQVIGCAIEVHRALGPGLLESTYEQCLAHELLLNNIYFRLQHPVPVEYKGIVLDCGYRIDLLVSDKLIVELKSVDKFKPIHEAQLLTYMNLARIKTGLLINFNVGRLKEGIRRFVL